MSKILYTKMDKEMKISIVGLGYVGLPLAHLFATKYAVVGFDINQHRIKEVNARKDSTFEVEDDVLQAVLVSNNPFGSSENAESSSNVFTHIIGNKKRILEKTDNRL